VNTQAQLEQTRAALADRRDRIEHSRGQVAQVALLRWQSLGIDMPMAVLSADSVEAVLSKLTASQWMATAASDQLQQFQADVAELSDLERGQAAAAAQIEVDRASLGQLAAEANERVAATQRVLNRLTESERNSLAQAQVLKAGQNYDMSKLVSSAGFVKPVNGPLTSPFGYRVHPIFGSSEMHDGADYGAPCGTPVVAAANGVVTTEEYYFGYGYRLIVDHGVIGGRSVVTSYNHLSSFAVPQGSMVQQNQVIAYVGATGTATGCHLHWSMWIDGGLTDANTQL
ncbi:MAG: peptidoglycan DD-metalloendopeptidase family protein, partial [Propionibacteriaceae bacterium]|nr:peptidoglycan DD-metalloendopeptidase family protein [Propionibacteriaceae bacterium]